MMPRPFFLFLAAALLCSARLDAGSARWGVNPADGDWNNAQNWTPATVPNAPADTARFGFSNLRNLLLSENTEVDGIVFDALASAYTITARPARVLTLSGTGITNNSAMTQEFVAAVDGNGNSGAIEFTGNATTAGSGTRFTAQGSMVTSPSVDVYGGTILFRDNSNAANGVFTANGGTFEGANGGFIGFYDASTAGDAAFASGGGSVAFANGAVIGFYGSSSAGQASFVNYGGVVGSDAADEFGHEGVTRKHQPEHSGNLPEVRVSFGAQTIFHNNSTAGRATLTNNGGAGRFAGGSVIRFLGNSSAGDATITNNGGAVSAANGAFSGFYDNSTASNAIITANGGAVAGAFGGGTLFLFNSDADEATLIANPGAPDAEGGRISFGDESTGGTSRILVFGNGHFDISSHSAPGVTIGSLQGTGNVFLGTNTLRVGSNHSSTTFSGALYDGAYSRGDGGTGGSFTKVGTGTLTLAGFNTYTGATNVEDGKLMIDGSVTSAVFVTGGFLGGTGNVGAVTVSPGGTLSPGNGTGILDIGGDLSLAFGSSLLIDVNGRTVGAEYDQANVVGRITLANATLSLGGSFIPTPGDMFTIVNNDGNDRADGIFGGLVEGALLAGGAGTFTISYTGGDGNDIVLTAVVPEPPAWFLLGAGSALLAAWHRRPRNCSLRKQSHLR